MFNLFKSTKERGFKLSIKNIIGISPKNVSLYIQAFRHNSVAKEIKEGLKNSNERLEFLGDSVLNTIIADYLFKKYPYKDEGFLTKMRSKLVSREHLNQLSLKLGLNKLLLLSSDPGLRNSSMNGDAFEALVGAIFLDRGFREAKEFIINRILNFHVDVEKLIETETDFKSKIIEWGQHEKKNLQFVLLQENGRGYEKNFLIAVTVEGEEIAQKQHISKKKAEQLAAEIACVKLGIV